MIKYTMDSAKDSYRVKAKNDKRRAKRHDSPNIKKMWGIAVPDLTIPNKYSYYYYTTKVKRNKSMSKYPNAKKIDPR